MKRICFGLLLLCVAGFLACDNGANNNNNATPNANSNASPTASAGSSPTIATSPSPPSGPVEVSIVITVTDKDGKPAIGSVIPDPADLTGGKIANWTVVNRSSLPEGQDMSVEIDQFKGNVTGGGLPFGTRPSENDFFLDLVQEGTTRHDISNPSKDNGKDETYKYTVTLFQKDGTVIQKLDPQIIVGIRLMDPKAGTTPTSGTKTASPSPAKSTPKP